MNGAHDLGGMQGFGPINPEPEAEEPVFHADWERRALAVSLAAGALGEWNIDISRHARERQHPIDYLRHSYYENWIAGLQTLLVEKGLATAEEVATGHAARPASQDLQARKLTVDQVAPAMAAGTPTTMDTEAGDPYRVGDRVRVRLSITTGHTRAPRYARGRPGTIAIHHGVHVFADANARGQKEGQNLYSVRFEASDLWGPEAADRGAVYIDLWDDHLDLA